MYLTQSLPTVTTSREFFITIITIIITITIVIATITTIVIINDLSLAIHLFEALEGISSVPQFPMAWML